MTAELQLITHAQSPLQINMFKQTSLWSMHFTVLCSVDKPVHS